MKTAGNKVSPKTICAHCGFAVIEHHVANYADPPNISEAVLICPWSVFKAIDEFASGGPDPSFGNPRSP